MPIRILTTSGSASSATDLSTTTTNFNTKLSSSDDTVQKALDTLDDHIHEPVIQVGTTAPDDNTKLWYDTN